MADDYKDDPIVNCWFAIDFQGKIAGAFRECTGLGSESQVMEYRGCDEKNPNYYRKVPGKNKYMDITLKRGITGSRDFWDWRKLVEDGKVNEARRDGSIRMFNADQTKAVAQWDFRKAWPTKIVGPATNANSTEAAIEEVSFTFEWYARVEPKS